MDSEVWEGDFPGDCYASGVNWKHEVCLLEALLWLCGSAESTHSLTSSQVSSEAQHKVWQKEGLFLLFACARALQTLLFWNAESSIPHQKSVVFGTDNKGLSKETSSGPFAGWKTKAHVLGVLSHKAGGLGKWCFVGFCKGYLEAS